MRVSSLFYQGTLGVIAGTMAYQFMGPGIIPFVTTGIGMAAVTYSVIKPKDDFKILFRNLGLYARDLNGEDIFPKVIKRQNISTGYLLILSLPYGLTTVDFEKVKYRLEQYYDAELEIDYHSKTAVIKVHTIKLPKEVDYEEVKTKPNQWVAGLRHDGKYELITFDDTTSHMFCAGMTGWGKTNFIAVNLYNANTQFTIDDVEYWLIDLKGGVGFSPFENAKLTKVFCDDVYDAGRVLLSLKRVTDERTKIRNKKRYTTQDFKPIFCVIDEYPDLMDFNQDAYRVLEYIARKARAVNIHIILTTQRASREYLPGTLKCNLAATMCFGCKYYTDSEVILGKGDYSGALIQYKGRAILDTPAKRITVQVPYIPEKDFDRLLEPYIEVKENANEPGLYAFGAYPQGQSDYGETGQLIAMPKGKTKRSYCKKKA